MTAPLADHRLAVIGAGPVGLEAALAGAALGADVRLYEAGDVGRNPRLWGHVRMFTPWSMNVSALGRRRLRETGAWTVTDEGACPTGAELVRDYLEPLSRLPEMASALRERHRVTAISRGGKLKGELGEARGRAPFRLLLDTPEGESVEEADLVIDASGVYGRPVALGRDGVPALGERTLHERIDRRLPDALGADRDRFAGRDVLVVGAGLSAATTLLAAAEAGPASLTWLTRGRKPRLAEVADDPLPERAALVRAVNTLASTDAVRHLSGPGVSAVRASGERLAVDVDLHDGSPVTLEVDTLAAHTGFAPDNSLYSELQVHECYASQGPMKLAALLVGGDCATQEGHGPESLRNPEPGFFILGNKSYGRNNNFLLRVGHEQVRDVFRLVTGDAALDLAAEPARG